MFPTLRINEAPSLPLIEILLIDNILAESRIAFEDHFALKCRHNLGCAWLSLVIPFNY
jgi:hypothetical protein